MLASVQEGRINSKNTVGNRCRDARHLDIHISAYPYDPFFRSAQHKRERDICEVCRYLILGIPVINRRDMQWKINREEKGTHVTQISIHIPVNFGDDFFRLAKEEKEKMSGGKVSLGKVRGSRNSL